LGEESKITVFFSRFTILTFFFALLVVWVCPVQAKIYICENSRGETEFTNVRESANCTELRSGNYWLNDTLPLINNNHSSRNTRSSWVHPGLYDEYIQNISDYYNVDSHLIKAVIRTESDFDCYAVSKKGAQGLMQLMPATARELNVKNSFDPQANIDGGTRYLKKMIEMFNGNLPLALAAYNAGPTLVKSKNRIPRIPETISYVRRVLGFYKQYKNTYGVIVPIRSTISIRKLIIN